MKTGNSLKFSVITATKNAEQHLEKTIKSVNSQIYLNFEHVIIDSLSNDRTLDIIKKYSNDHRIKLISEKDKGISDAFNKGIKLSSGDWIIFLGAGDTFINSDVLLFANRHLKALKNNYIVWGNTLLIDNNLKMVKRINGNITKSKLKRYMCLPHQSTFHNKTFFQKFGVYDNIYKSSMDYDLLLKSINQIKMNGYIDFDVAFVLKGGISEEGFKALKEFRIIQKKYKIRKPEILTDFIYFWAVFKRFIANILYINK